MPLMKKALENTATASDNGVITVGSQSAVLPTPASQAPQALGKKLGGTRLAGAKAEASMTKDGYWERKEARDIRTGECIRLSGILQALLGSVNYGQYCTVNSREAYLEQAKKDAKELAKFVTDEA